MVIFYSRKLKKSVNYVGGMSDRVAVNKFFKPGSKNLGHTTIVFNIRKYCTLTPIAAAILLTVCISLCILSPYVRQLTVQ